MEWSSKIIHPEKVLFPQNNITKGDLLKYYKNIANHILPYIRNHPLTIHCFPHGIAEEGFYRQHAMENTPETCELKRKMGGTVKHILCSDVESLAYLVNQNTIEIHRWLSTVENPENPNILIIDIDSPNTRFDLACKAAKLLKIQLENRSFKPYVMTTGSVGLHIISYVQKMNYDQVRNMLHGITSTIAQEYPNEFSVDVRKRLRENLTYLDISRNSYGQAAIAPFSVRAKKNAPVAAPLNWKELDDSALTSNKFTINNIFEHL
ncbi:MAG: DNA polymerase domain-containing protein [Wolbachia pipientis]